MNRRYLIAIFWILIHYSFLGFGQKNTLTASASDCSGAIQMESGLLLQPKLLEESGAVDELKAYSEKLQFTETNSLWFAFNSPHAGWLKLGLEKFGFPLEYGVFILNKEESCTEIINGQAKLYSHELLTEKQHAMVIDSIHYSKNQLVLLFVNTNSSEKKQIAIQAQFKEEVSENEYNSMMEVFDLRTSSKEAPFRVKIRDLKSKLPVVANIIISESRTFNALYTASDIVFPYSDNLKMMLKIDASGYFFQDVEINSRKNPASEQIIYLEALEQDQLIELEGLVFEPQTDMLLPDAKPKLKRLKDFMIINTEVNIEIQGHVHLAGKNTGKAKRLSKKRAQTVEDFLIESGIDKDRLSVVGFGNSKMKYPEAETDAEKQANRRVEIKIK